MKERLQKILSAHGVASRREAEALIRAGRIRVNGQIALIGQSADLDCDDITIDGEYIRQKDKHVYIMLNKPRGYITTLKDEQNRPTVMDLVKDLNIRLHPVGRLDANSEGLLLLTNDGSLTNKITHPSNEKQKTYQVEVNGDLASALDALRKPMIIDGYTIRPAEVVLIKKKAKGGIITITIHEGRNRQIRKMCAICNIEVLRLIRISESSLRLGNLKSGKWRHLTTDEVTSLFCTNHCKNEGSKD